jgi:hypothetical protein
LATWRDQRPWRLGWAELTDERQRRAARPSDQGIWLSLTAAAVVLSAAHYGHEFFSCAAPTYACRSARSIERTFGRTISTDKSSETLV